MIGYYFHCEACDTYASGVGFVFCPQCRRPMTSVRRDNVSLERARPDVRSRFAMWLFMTWGLPRIPKYAGTRRAWIARQKAVWKIHQWVRRAVFR